MARHGFAIGLLTALALGVAGCGQAAESPGRAEEAAVEVAAAMGVEGQALAAMGFDPGELDLVAAAAPSPAGSAAPEASPNPRDKAGERGDEWRKRRQARVLLRQNTLHGEVVVKTKEGDTKTVVVQRGEVTAIDGDSMTVKCTDGFTLTWTFGDRLRVVERRTTIRSSDIKVGTTVGIAGAKDGDASVARLIVVPAKQR